MSPTPKARFKRRFLGLRPWTKHSMVLLVAGFVYVAMGASMFTYTPGGLRSKALIIALSWFPVQFWASIFIAVGLGAAISARWPPVARAWGYSALTGLSAGWSATYAMGVIFEDTPVGNLSYTLLWGLVAFLWWAIGSLTKSDLVVVTEAHGRNRDS